MQELRLILAAAAYLILGYLLILVPLAWLATRGEPDMQTEWNWVLTPVLWPLRLVLAPFGVKLKRPTSSAQALSNDDSRDGDDSASAAVATGQFRSQRKAKEYLIGGIVAEAEREGVPLSEVERKMLYFSETDWAPPGMLDVNAEFERDYDDAEYEAKIAGLVRNLESHQTPEQQEQWDDAVMKLSEGDHYLLVLIDAISPSRGASGILGKLGPWLPASSGSAPRPRGDFFRLVIVAILCGIALMALMALLDHFGLLRHR